MSKDFGHAFFEDQHPFLDSSFSGFLLKQLQRFVHRLVRESESAVVHGNHPLRIQVEEGAGGVAGTGVDIAKRWRIISADWKQGELRGQARANLAKLGEISGVTGVINRM